MIYDVSLTAFAVEAEFSPGVWTDITVDTVGEIGVSYGIMGNDIPVRTASSGRMTVDLNNSDSNSGGLTGYYSPHHADCREGFSIGLPMRLKFVYGDLDPVYKFLGRIPAKGIEVAPGVYRSRRTKVTAYDWMNEAASHEIALPVEDGLRADQAIQMILDEMTHPPANTELAEGVSIFPTVFDKDRAGGRALTALQNLAVSEFGFVYVKRNQTDGETLVFEDRYTRALVGIKQIQKTDCCLDALAAEDGAILLTEDEEIILIDAVYEAIYDNPVDGGYDDELINHVQVTVNPRDTDIEDDVLLARLNKPVYLEPGETRDIKIPYRDPSNKVSNVAGIDMIDPPEAGVDYWMNALENGSGTDMTDDLAAVPAFASTSVVYSVTNNGATGGYVYVQARGRGIYSFDTVTSISQDSGSITAYQKQQLTINLPYQDDAYFGQSLGDYLVNEYAQPKPDIAWVEMVANTSDFTMLSFLMIEPGDRIRISEAVGGADLDYFVNGVEFRVKDHEIVRFRWYLTRAFSANDDWFLIGASLLGGDDVLAV
jgi:hypothetical protein